MGHGPWGSKELDSTERLSRQACTGNQNGRGQKSNQILNTCQVDRLVVNDKDLKSQTLKKKKVRKVWKKPGLNHRNPQMPKK